MYKILYTYLILLLNFGYCLAQHNKIPIAVVDLEASGVTVAEAKTLTDRLRMELVSIGKFEVMERDKMGAILKEHGLQQTICMGDECILDIGRLAAGFAVSGFAAGAQHQRRLEQIVVAAVGAGADEGLVERDALGGHLGRGVGVPRAERLGDHRLDLVQVELLVDLVLS